MLRRDFLFALGSSLMWLTEPNAVMAAESTGEAVAAMARRLALAPYEAPTTNLPPRLAAIDYDSYRKIRFNPGRALWADGQSPFSAQYFHRGFYFKEEVDLFEVVNGAAQAIAFSPDQFVYEGFDPSGLPADLGYAGFRMHGRLNAPDVIDEILVFLGASYFRGLGRANVYGLSARGLALKTGDPAGEEFPRFSKFWLERPAPDATSFTIHALLDSPSLAGAYTFIVTPGDPTIMDVQARLFPRIDIAQVGIAPLTSMFLFSPADRAGVDDFRQSVHDSDGLLIWNGAGEQIWRPLSNPAGLQESVFNDKSPKGFGLMQRARQSADYQDFEARYESRPSVWIEPAGNWGRGAIHLFEIPADVETIDNIVMFWRPAKAWPAGSERRLAYKMFWGASPTPSGLPLVVTETRAGRGGPAYAPTDASRLYAVTFSGKDADVSGLTANVSASTGAINNIVLTPTPEGGVRLTFELTPGEASVSELRAYLSRAGVSVSETWLNRWTH